jgi:hypothetical protein
VAALEPFETFIHSGEAGGIRRTICEIDILSPVRPSSSPSDSAVGYVLTVPALVMRTRSLAGGPSDNRDG